MWYQSLVDASTMVAHFRYLDALATAGTATEASTLPSVGWSPEGVTISAGLDGLSIVESRVTDSIAPAALSQIAEQGGTALARAIDLSLATLFPSMTAGTVGSSGAALTFDHITQAMADLDANYAIGPKKGFLHPQQWFDLVTNIKSLNYGVSFMKVVVDPDTGRQEEVLDLNGVEIRKNALVTKINSAADYAGGIFCEQALGLAVAQNPFVEINKIPQKHAWAVDCTVAFGTGVIRPKFGVLVQSGVTA